MEVMTTTVDTTDRSLSIVRGLVHRLSFTVRNKTAHINIFRRKRFKGCSQHCRHFCHSIVLNRLLECGNVYQYKTRNVKTYMTVGDGVGNKKNVTEDHKMNYKDSLVDFNRCHIIFFPFC